VFSSVSAVKSSRLRSRAAVCAAVAGCGLAAVSSASASTLAVDATGTLRFQAAPGEANSVTLTDVNTGGATVVTDPGSTVHVGVGCIAVTAHQGRCPLPAGQDQEVRIDLADLDDSAQAFKLNFGAIRIAGGSGDDTISDAPQSGAEVSGGTGSDTITVHPNFGGRVDVHGDGGNDAITAQSASGVVDGDGGDDQITLNSFVQPGGDRPISAAYGGGGADSISAGGGTFMGLISGQGGDDAITTADFATVSVIDGGGGADTITSPTGFSEQIFAGPGRDVVNGGGGNDTIDCGAAIDRYVIYLGDTVTNCEVPFTP
jgi:Ca2+-binding RTX toxin-like protein